MAARPRRRLTVCQTGFPASEHRHSGSWEVAGRGRGARSAERPLAPMPARSLQHSGTPVALCVSPSLSASRLLPQPRVYFCQLPYSRLHSAFARTHETFLFRAGEALPPTAGTPGKMLNRHTSLCGQAPRRLQGLGTRWSQTVPLSLSPRGRSVCLFRPWCDTACPMRYTNTGSGLCPCGRTSSICTHHYDEGPSVKTPAFLISGVLSGKIVASGQQQKAECCGNSRELWLLFDHTMGV
ncbi:hypothetical protein EYF80_008505 [Liparis tanakae]|uniref:Uncharacterized protein n=1 Tax=Liparis tanakae TaxID=230148 RepID=A0A4Z2ITM1_9TELE|nr:hypothetical protein EYF80_008505 [Liparis tanakae]